jgi:shikimate kinase
MKIVIYGFMAVGKTTVGKLLSEKIGYNFIDMDAEIEKNMGISISDIFRLYGEQRFRQLEAELVKELSKKDGLVIACGGGVVANPANAEELRKSSKMVYLTASLEEILRRSNANRNRPLLDVKNPAEEAIRLNNERKPIYEKYADLIVNTTGKTPNEVVEMVMEMLA